jgi:ribosomal protein L11 methyltransferase
MGISIRPKRIFSAMEWIEAKIRIDFDNCEQAADLISNIFYNLGVKGVVIDDPDLMPDEAWGEDAVGPPDSCCVSGFFPDTSALREKLSALEQRIHTMEKKSGLRCRIEYLRTDEVNWAESWKDFFWPEKITSRITVKPTWRPYEPRSEEIVVEIDPGMAFGTGTHPTTAMCIRLIEVYLKKGDAFLDVGTGSGILMAVAAKLGAATLCGIDNDEIAVEIAEKNLILNQISKDRFHLKTDELLGNVHERFDVIAANILSQEILFLLDSVMLNLSSPGILICSGIIEKNSPAIEAKIKRLGLNLLEIQKEEGWIAIASCR